MEFGMFHRIKPKRNMCAFQWRKFGTIWTVCRKIKNCGATWRNLDLVGRNVAYIWPIVFFSYLSTPSFSFFFILFPLLCPVSYLFFLIYLVSSSSYYVIIFLHHFCQPSVSIKISNLLICFCSFDLSCPILEKDNYINNKKDIK